MLIEHGIMPSQMIILAEIGEMVPINKAGYQKLWVMICDVTAFHTMMKHHHGQDYYITVNGHKLDEHITNAEQFQEWYENDVKHR